MEFRRVVLLAGIAVVATTTLTPAAHKVTFGPTLLHFQPVSPPFSPLTGPESGGAVLYTPHDGTFETAFTLSTQEDAEFAQFWIFPSSEGTLVAFEACFYSFTTVPGFQYKFVYYSASTGGEEAEPGSLREDRDSPIFDILANTVTCQPIIFEAQGDPGVEVRELLTYLGAKWNGQDFPSVYILVDTNGPNTTNGWGRATDFGSDWLPLRFTEPFTAYRNLAIRFAWFGPTLPPCDGPNDLTLQDQTITTTELYEACEEIRLGPNLFIDPPADVSLMTPGTVIFRNGVSVGNGAKLTAGTSQSIGVFVSSDSFTGGFGGLAAADATCQSLGTAAVPGSGPWVAWLSDSATDAKDRIPQPSGTGSYVRAGFPGIVIADDLADLTDGSLDNQVGDFDEDGNPVAGNPWTGTESDGTVGTETCLDWTSSQNSDAGVVGNRLSIDANWTNDFLLACDQPRHLYCFGAVP